MDGGGGPPSHSTGRGTPPCALPIQQVLLGTQVQAVAVTTTAVSPQILGGMVTVSQPHLTRSLAQPAPGMFLIQQGSTQAELQIPRTQVIGITTPVTSVSASGGTIHHLGHSPPRGGPSPLVNPQMLHMQNNPLNTNTGGQTQTPRRGSSTGSSGMSIPGTPIPGLFPGNPQVPKSPIRTPERPRKKLKLEEKPPPSPEVASLRKLTVDYKIKQLTELKENYNEHLTELFYLQSGLNIMDYHAWKKRPSAQLVQFLKSGQLDSDDEDMHEKKINDEVKVLTTSGGTTPLATPVAISTQLPAAVAAMQQQGGDNKKAGGRHGMVFAHIPSSQGTSTPNGSQPGTPVTSTVALTGRPTVAQLLQSACSTPTSSSPSTPLGGLVKSESTILPATSGNSVSSNKPVKSPGSAQKTIKQGAASALDSTIGSQEAIVERAKQEAQVMQRIAELRKEGLWSTRRLPKVQEQPRAKAHWDYLLEEMQWLAADFAQERKWKKAGARKIARMIAKHFQEIQQKEVRAEKEEAMKLKRIASSMAKMVKEFWQNIEKVVQYKQQSRLEEKRKKALDLHLSFIVDQTEKYSSWLTEGLTTASTTSSISGSISASPAHSTGFEDVDFEPEKDESDDEETIAKEEEETGLNEEYTKLELNELLEEGNMPLDQLLQTLPSEVLEKPASLEPADSGSDSAVGDQGQRDEEFDSEAEDASDDEETLEEQEQHERTEEDNSQELDDLQDEGEMPIEELVKKYAGAYDSDFEAELEAKEEDETDDETEEDEEETDEYEEPLDEEEDIDVEGDDDSEDVGMEMLVQDGQGGGDTGPNKEITDIAALAGSLQPTGYTLETTKVKTSVPFLLRHTLREYQHVGLDWLATMNERRLNGILADEMGLGKTIQTIALLAHLVCDHGIWGPHLIVVPTSVMLNWEMEFKKWCPALKILTYYGTQKERKQKRQGWTKTNAFHVCITSYKLVIQDHQAFRRKKWKYFILDEAQNIKNFKSQRWQTLLNFQSQRRLLLTGTPLQNSLMELWSLMHFLMPHVFASHREFKEWFSTPLSSMVEGSREYNEGLIRRLHKVLRPFLLRRLKHDVEKQLPKKYEHVVMCRLSKRQRYLYDDFMSQTRTKETLATGHFMSVINILMQLRKVCNHPNLFDPRPVVSPFQMEGITYTTASAVLRALEKDPLQYIDPCEPHPCLAELEMQLPAFAAHRIRKLQTPRPLIEEIDSAPSPPPRPRPIKLSRTSLVKSAAPLIQQSVTRPRSPILSSIRPCSPSHPKSVPSTPSKDEAVTTTAPSPLVSAAVSVATTQLEQLPGYTPTAASKLLAQQRALAATTAPTIVSTPTSQAITSQPITLHVQQTQQGTRLLIPSGQLAQLPAGLLSIVQTSTGQQIITSQPLQQNQSLSQQLSPAVTAARPVINGPVTLLSSPSSAVTVAATVAAVTTAGTVQSSAQSSRAAPVVQLPSSVLAQGMSKPVMRVAPLTSGSTAPPSTAVTVNSNSQPVTRPTPTSTSLLLGNKSPVSTRSASRSQVVKQRKTKEKSIFVLESLENAKVEERRAKLERIASFNKRNCDFKPVYGQDLFHAVNIFEQPDVPRSHSQWKGEGYVHCFRAQHPHLFPPNQPPMVLNQAEALVHMVKKPEDYLTELSDVLHRFVFVTPSVQAPRIQMHASHPSPSWLLKESQLRHQLHAQLAPKTSCLHQIQSKNHVQFPELRLIQYDCGKLQTLDVLLRRLKSGDHRVLIFTQMTRMLDVLEQFLNFHGHRYLRLDGTTRVEQRQALMDRFNMDKRIFVFILSTRSGGIGVNLTGADTVIFYDSDWNPTMDAQAQDRCHRIGQTRDVHIYRLISEMTIEENILKKANQKRLLGDVAIEGGNFTTAFFREQTIKELFEEPSGLESLTKGKQRSDVVVEQAKPKVLPAPSRRSRSATPTQKEGALTSEQMELALCNAEDDADVVAAKVAKAEQKAELAEFDEEIPWDEKEEQQKKEEESSKLEQELALLDKELTPIERFAVHWLEAQLAPVSNEELESAEKEVELAKEEWELSRLQALKEEEELRAAVEEDEMLFTYSQDEGSNQVFICDQTGEHMPMWAPPSPPRDDNDVYIDQTVCFMYEPTAMPESQLPPVYIKKAHKKIKVEHVPGRKHKIRKDDQVRVPRSLFDRPSAAMLKLRKEAKIARLKQGVFRGPTGLKLPSVTSGADTAAEHPEWLIHEDWALLQAVQTLMDVPLNLMIISPAHIPNWDMVSDVVNATSRVYRSAKQCRNRYETVIVPREEGRILYDMNPRKQKKTKGIYKTKNNRPMKTGQLHLQDNNQSQTTLYTLRFDSCKSLAAKRSPTLRPTLASPVNKNPKHAAVLAESGINYDTPMTPIQVAKIRAERIAREKKRNQEQQAASAAAAATQTTAATTVAGQTVVTVAAGTAFAATAQTAGTNAATTILASGLQKSALAGGVTAVSLARSLGSSIVVNTGGATVGALSQVRTTRVATTMTVQEITAAVANQAQASRVATVPGAQVISSTNLTPAQLVAAQRAAAVASTTVTTAGVTHQLPTQATAKSLTAQQLNMIRTQQILRQQQQAKLNQGRITSLTPQQAEQLKQQQLKRLQTAAVPGNTVIGTVQKSVAVTTPLITSVTGATAITQTARLQTQKTGTLKPTVGRSMTREEMAALFKNAQQPQQLQKAAAAGQGGATLHQVVTLPQVGQLLQTVQQGTVGTSGQVPTLVKTVSGSMPSVTIPVSAISAAGITIPQQKAGTGKTAVAPQLHHQIRLQQMAQRKATAQLTQQKVATLTPGQVQQIKSPLTASLGAVQIIQQQQPKIGHTVSLQQIQQLVKQSQQQQSASGGTPTIQQIITSVGGSQTTTATVIAATIVTQAQAQSPVHTVTKVSVPGGIVTTTLAQSPRTSGVIGVTTVATTGAATLITSTPTTQTVTVTIASSPAVASPSHAQQTVMKPIQEVVQMSPGKALPVSQAVAQQLKSGVVQHIPISRPAPGQTVTITQPGQLTGKGPSVSVQQVVQQVQAQAEQQAQQRISAITVAGPPPVTITQVTPPAAASTAMATPQPASVTMVTQPAVTVQQSPVTTQPGAQQQARGTPYSMRLRNK